MEILEHARRQAGGGEALGEALGDQRGLRRMLEDHRIAAGRCRPRAAAGAAAICGASASGRSTYTRPSPGEMVRREAVMPAALVGAGPRPARAGEARGFAPVAPSPAFGRPGRPRAGPYDSGG